MRAALYDTLGSAHQVLRVEEVPRPEPGPAEVRVKIEFSGVNPTDWKSRSGATARPIEGFQIPHHDSAGVIDAVGDGVDPARIGQRVWLWLAAAGRQWGAAAEWSVVPERQAVPLPDGVSAGAGRRRRRSGADRASLPVRRWPGGGQERAGRRGRRGGWPLRDRAGQARRRPGGHDGKRSGEGEARRRGRCRPGRELQERGRGPAGAVFRQPDGPDRRACPRCQPGARPGRRQPERTLWTMRRRAPTPCFRSGPA